MSKQIGSTAPKYDNETQKIVHEMLVENSGCSPQYRDGEHYGWQILRNEGDFRKSPYQKVDADVGIVKHIFHLINERLEYDKNMDERFHRFAESKDNKESGYDELIEEFCEKFNENTDEYEEKCEGTYTYNYGTLLSRDIKQWNPEIGGKRYVIIQIHTGDDASYGFSTPRVFACEDYEGWLSSWTDSSVYCGCRSAHCQLNDWFGDDGGSAPLGYEDGIYKHWEWKDDGRLHCTKCNGIAG